MDIVNCNKTILRYNIYYYVPIPIVVDEYVSKDINLYNIMLQITGNW